MKASIFALSPTLALMACGAENHDDPESVVWSATSMPPGARAAIEGDALVLEVDGPGQESWPVAPDTSLQIGIDLPAGDFAVRFSGVSLPGAPGMVGALVEGGGVLWASTYLMRDGRGSSTLTAQVGDELGTRADRKGFDGSPADTADLSLVRAGHDVEVTASSGGQQAALINLVGDGPLRLTLFLEAAPAEVAPAATTRAAIARREVDTNIGSFALDEVAE
jgi:hypothetical protein